MVRLNMAPPSGRMKEWMASQALSTQATLSAKLRHCADTGDADNPVVREHIERAQLVGQGDPAVHHRQPGRENDKVEAPARKQADGSGQRDEFDGAHVLQTKPNALRRNSSFDKSALLCHGGRCSVSNIVLCRSCLRR